VTDKDEKLDQEVREGLGGLDVPPPDPAARRRAIAMARAEFEEARRVDTAATAEGKTEKSSQGFLGWLRLIVGKQPDEDKAMIPFNQKLLYPGVAAAAVAAIAVGISLQDQVTPNLPGIPADLETGAAEAQFREPEVRADEYLRREQKVAPREAAPREAVLREAVPREAAPREAAPTDHRTLDLAEEDMALVQPQPSSAADAMHGRQRPLMAMEEPIPVPYYQDVGRDKFEAFEQNPVKLVSEAPVSTFSADVDTASYSFVRRMLKQGLLPQVDAVRAEEMINYFDYDYALPESPDRPFKPTVAVSDSPWAEGRKLMHIGIKGFDIPADARPRSNLVFLLDVSGSMNSPDKLPLVKQSMELLLTTLDPDDTVAIAVYAGAAGTVLEPTPVKDKQKILDAMRQLSAGGATAGAQGIRLAYELAESRFDKEAVNRVILATDGDFNVGITDRRELQSFIERKRERGIFLSVLGFGQGNYRDEIMQTLAQNGNGVAAYVDTLSEARKLLVDEATSTLFPIARDVKLQLEFNPAAVAEYRLIGYETRRLNREDFNNDAVDAGDIGAGHTVTAIYEFTPVGSDARQIEESRYAPKAVIDGRRDEYAFLKIRYKLPEEDVSRLISRPVTSADAVELGEKVIGREAGFATAVAAFAQLLKGGRNTGDYDYDDVIELALKTRGQDPYGYRTEFIQLVRAAKTAAAMRAR
jgi:Ca-activated chloride channel family protein